MYLYIDTTTEKTILALISENGEVIKRDESLSGFSHSEKLLIQIDDFLLGFNREKLLGILTNPGPGSYTGIRIGLTTANLMGFSLNIPVISLKGLENFSRPNRNNSDFDQSVMPEYNKEPFITKEKPRL